MLRLPLALLMLSWALVGTAHAQEEACGEPGYTHDEWLAGMNAADAALFQFDFEGSRSHLSTIHRSLRCLDEVASRSYVARFARQLALALFFDQDDLGVMRWSRLSTEAMPDLAWPADLPSDHTFRVMAAEAEPRLSSVPAGLGLLPPPGGGVFLNGALLSEPVATVETPGLLQVFDKKGRRTHGVWQDGASFPDEVLSEGAPAARPPRWWDGGDPRADGVIDPAATLFPQEMEQPPEPAKPDPAVVASAASQPYIAGDYIDPFVDARRRLALREVSSREGVDAASGLGMTVTNELVVYEPDPSHGRPVTGALFADWLVTEPTWTREAAIAGGRADKAYLRDWTTTGPTPDKRDAPITGVSWHAATAYCGSWGNPLDDAGRSPPDGLEWELRAQGTEPVRRSADGVVEAVDPTQTWPDVGFRCAR